MIRRAPRGFTLIELLMVVAIIAVLSSIVLSSVRAARLHAMDASVRQHALELRTILQQEWTNSGTYTAIKSGGSWKGVSSSCSAASFSGQFAARAAEVCSKLVRATGNTCGTTCVYFQTTNPNDAAKFSIQAYLPGVSADRGMAHYLCIGSSGNQSISDGAAWTEDGCNANP